MPIPSEDVVRRVLGSGTRGVLIRASISDAWAIYQEKYPERAWFRRKSTRAALIWEHAVNNAISAFDGDAGFKPVNHDDTFSFVFDQSVLVRFKKADLELKTRNYPTALATLFHTHDAELPGFEDLHRVEAAYVLNRFQTGIDWIGITARHKKKQLWQFELEGGGVVERLPVPERLDDAATRVMKPKAAPEGESAREDGIE